MEFVKYCATGNDFILVDNRTKGITLTREQVQNICFRRAGVGADGLVMIEGSAEHDFKMRIFNADGGEASMCGNGARAATMFVFEELGLRKENYTFETKNGVYFSKYQGDGLVQVQMNELYDVGKYKVNDLFPSSEAMYLNTGCPHTVFLVDSVDKVDMEKDGQRIREDLRFKEGTNVNFAEVIKTGKVKVRTYEKGVEAETLSCGTGVVATAVLLREKMNWVDEIDVETQGGDLKVIFTKEGAILFMGKVFKVYSGSL